MSASPPPPLPTPGQNTAFAHQAAKGSWVCAALIFGVIAFGSRTSAKLIIDLVSLLLMVVGLLSGIIALFGIRKHGIRGILAPALVGIAINGLFAFIFVTNFVAARARAREAANRAASPALANASVKSTDVVTRLRQHILQKRRKMIVDTNQTEILWSDGAILEAGTNFPPPCSN
jgi:hypothetical protein